MADIQFTRDEISIIEKNLGFIVFDWAKHLVTHVLGQARSAGVQTVYMNTINTLDAGAITEGKVDYFYERLPPLLGFRKEEANLRGRGNETLWTYHLGELHAANLSYLFKMAKKIALESLPPKYQGAFIGMLGKKPFYTSEEVQQVLSILEKKQKKPKSFSKFLYDWDSATWSGSQRFRNDVTETVVMQRPSEVVRNLMIENEALTKFWSLILSQYQHGFSEPDVIGWALISKISRDIWVINEIQTDCVNAYMKLRRLDKSDYEERSEKITWEVLTHMLEAQNKTD